MVKNITDFFSVITGDRIVNHFRQYNSVLPFHQISDDQLKSFIHGVNSSINLSIQDKINELDNLIIEDRDDNSILSEIDPDLNMLFNMNDTIKTPVDILILVTSVQVFISINTISPFLMLTSEAWLQI